MVSQNEKVRESSVEMMDDRILTERAKAGDTEAFGELVRRHRTSAHYWARSMTRDTHMAEDIVQDSLIKAFLHVGQLIDSSRFMGWLQAIVRNQAQMNLRRGGPYRKELPFTSLAQADSIRAEQVDWSDVDSILTFLSSNLAQKQDESNPEALYLRKETIEMIHSFLHCLNRKERGIFEAYFFKQWSPSEIAALFQTTTQSVYTYIYRAKRKVRQEHSRMILPAKSSQDQEGGSSMKKLSLPETKAPATSFSLIDCVYRILQMEKKKLSVTELMGRSGSAFRLRISGMATYADGVFVFDWKKVLTQLFAEAGYEAQFLCGQLPDEGVVPLTPVSASFPFARANDRRVVSFVKPFIDTGTPVLFFDTYVQMPFTYEWSLIWGYNEEQQVFYVTDPVAPYVKTVAYEELENSSLRFLCGISRMSEPNSDNREGTTFEHLREIIKIGVEGDGFDPHTPFPFYTQGLAAYEALLQHLEQGYNRFSAYGMSYLAHVYADIRKHAALYLNGLKSEITSAGTDCGLASTLQAAIAGYERVALEWKQISDLFPFISKFESYDRSTIKEVYQRLGQARAAETEALQNLQQTVNFSPV